MNDGFNEDRQEIVAKIVTQQQEAIKERRAANAPEYMENVYDLHRFTTDPALINRYPNIDEIDKNWVLANLKTKDQRVLLMMDSFMDDVDFVLPEGTGNNLIRSSLIREMQAINTTSRALGGKAAELLVTQIGSTKTEISGLEAKKKKSILSFGKKE